MKSIFKVEKLDASTMHVFAYPVPKMHSLTTHFLLSASADIDYVCHPNM